MKIITNIKHRLDDHGLGENEQEDDKTVPQKAEQAMRLTQMMSSCRQAPPPGNR